MKYTTEELRELAEIGTFPIKTLTPKDGEVIVKSTMFEGMGSIHKIPTKADNTAFVNEMKDYALRKRRGQLTAEEKADLVIAKSA